MKKVIVTQAVVEYDEDGVTLDDSLFGKMASPVVFDTMEEAGHYIEEKSHEEYINNESYVFHDAVRCNKNGNKDIWQVTVYYDGGFAVYEATVVEI